MTDAVNASYLLGSREGRLEAVLEQLEAGDLSPTLFAVGVGARFGEQFGFVVVLCSRAGLVNSLGGIPPDPACSYGVVGDQSQAEPSAEMAAKCLGDLIS